MTKLQRIEEIAKRGHAMTTKDKEFVSKLSKELGVDFTPRPGCQDCYADQAIRLRKVMTANNADKTDAAYVLIDGFDSYFGSIRVNASTLTDELAEEIIAKGFDKVFFKKCK